MSFYLLNVQNPENDYTTGKRIVTAHFECDTVSDLPALVQSTYIARIGSTAHIIENNSRYAVKSNGVWCVQETGTDVYTKSQIDTMLAGKANTATTLAGYGITNAYTKTQTDTMLAGKANTATTLAGYGITNAYTKTQTDTAISNAVSGKITIGDVFGIGTTIQENSDLNNYTDVGVYTCPNITIANSLVNSPVSGIAFRMEVTYLNNRNRYRQSIYPLQNYTYYARVYTSSGWQAWYKFDGVQV